MALSFAFKDLHAQKIHKFEQLNVVDGLSQNFVQSILCDDKGFLWFGTWDGLNRYDGRQFKIFKVNSDQKIRSQIIGSLIFGKTNKIPCG